MVQSPPTTSSQETECLFWDTTHTHIYLLTYFSRTYTGKLHQLQLMYFFITPFLCTAFTRVRIAYTDTTIQHIQNTRIGLQQIHPKAHVGEVTISCSPERKQLIFVYIFMYYVQKHIFASFKCKVEQKTLRLGIYLIQEINLDGPAQGTEERRANVCKGQKSLKRGLHSLRAFQFIFYHKFYVLLLELQNYDNPE